MNEKSVFNTPGVLKKIPLEKLALLMKMQATFKISLKKHKRCLKKTHKRRKYVQLLTLKGQYPFRLLQVNYFGSELHQKRPEYRIRKYKGFCGAVLVLTLQRPLRKLWNTWR